MTTVNETVVEMDEVVEEKKNAIMGNMEKALQVGLGVIALGQDLLEDMQEDANDFVKKLLERGEEFEQDGRKFFNEMVEKRKKQADEMTDKAEQELEERVTAVLHRLNVPTKDDIAELGKKIDTLNRKVNELKRTKAE